MERCLYKRFIRRLGSCDCAGREVSRCAACKLKNQESEWCHSVCMWGPETRAAEGERPSLAQRPVDQGVSCVRTSPSAKSWEPRLPAGKDRRGWCLSSEQREQVQPSSTPSLCSGPMTPSRISEDEFLLSLRIQMLTPSGSTLTNTPRNNIVPAIWASLSLVTLTHKINHHTDVSIFQQQSEIQIFM